MADLKIFGGSGTMALTVKICEYLQTIPGRVSFARFPDGESFLKIDDDVRGKDCFVILSTCPPVNANVMELLLFLDCLRRASADRITAVIPYFGYARQDRKSEGRTPITAKLVANLITSAGAHRVLAMDLHADQIQGFFDLPVDHLSASPVFLKHFRALNLDMNNTVLLSPDVGNIKTATAFADHLGGELAVVDKRRVSGDKTVAGNIVGNVKDKTVLMFDDMITTAGTTFEAVKVAREHGAREIYVSATHPVLIKPAIERLQEMEPTQICVTDTIPVRDEVCQALARIKILSVADLMGEAIRRIHRHESISAMFS